jgi:hypothetical protein
MHPFIINLANSLVSTNVASPSEIKGCTREEVESLERREGIRLPDLYKDFLRVMGKSAGRFLEGTDAFYRHLPHLRNGAEESLRESKSSFRLPQNAFVFVSHQGYVFLFFIASESEDPPVWIYQEGEQSPVEKWPSLSAYLESVLVGTVKLMKEFPQKD